MKESDPAQILGSWKRKVTLEKLRPDGSCQVTIEVPARHSGMLDNQSEGQFVDVRKTQTSLFSHDKLESVDQVSEESRDGCQEEDSEEAGKEDKILKIPVILMSKKHGEKWMATQSFEHKLMSLEDVLRDQIKDFEKEYKDVFDSIEQQRQDLVKLTAKTVPILLETPL